MSLLIFDNSSLYKKMFREAAAELDKNAAITFVESRNAAFDSIKRNDYDVLVIDLEVHEFETFEFFKKITIETPDALVLVTATPSPASDGLCAAAMAEGAVDYMIKPVNDSYGENFDVVKRKMSEVFKIAYEKREMKDQQPENTPREITEIITESDFQPKIVLIAVSTGGPHALESILPGLGANFPVPVLIVQHIAPRFTEHLAAQLNQKSRLTVKVAEDGEIVKAGTVYIAPGGVHMKLNAENKIQLDDSPPVNGVRPAADVLFRSVAESFPERGVLAVILTGMGSDGRNGLKVLKEKLDCFCLAQSEETCVVYGMPRVAVESGLVDEVLDLNEISARIESLVEKIRGKRRSSE